MAVSVLHRWIFFLMTSGESSRLILLPSFSALLLILLVPSSNDMIRAPSFTIIASGSRNTRRFFKPFLQN